MKNYLLLFAVIFASCSSRMELMKRHYRSGWTVFKGHHQHTAPPVAKQSARLPAENKQARRGVEVEAARFAEATDRSTATNSPAKLEASAAAPVKHIAAVKQIELEKALVAEKQHRYAQKPVKRGSKQNADAMFIVAVILCFFPFINLISVYWHDSDSITINFVVTLLLDITVILGIVVALLIVLNMVDFR